MFALHDCYWMIVCCCVDQSSTDGEQFVGDQEYFEDQQDYQGPFDQGKYNLK